MQEAEDKWPCGKRSSVRRPSDTTRPIMLVRAWHPLTHRWFKRSPTLASRLRTSPNGHTTPYATFGQMARRRAMDSQTTITRSICGGSGVQITR
jgi:hypothetical protein